MTFSFACSSRYYIVNEQEILLHARSSQKWFFLEHCFISICEIAFCLCCVLVPVCPELLHFLSPVILYFSRHRKKKKLSVSLEQQLHMTSFCLTPCAFKLSAHCCLHLPDLSFSFCHLPSGTWSHAVAYISRSRDMFLKVVVDMCRVLWCCISCHVYDVGEPNL